MNTSTKDEALTKIEVLKVLLPEPHKSIYALWDILKEKYGGKKANYPTLHRRIKELTKEKLIETEEGTTKKGKIDKRGTQNLGLSFKGLVYLILKAGLNETESRMIVDKIYSKPFFQKFEVSKNYSIPTISVDSLTEMFSQLKPRVNLEHFDEDYVKKLLFETLILKNCLKNIHGWQKKTLSKLSERELKKLRKKAKKDVKLLGDEIKTLFVVNDYLKEKRDDWQDRINMLKPIVNVFKKNGHTY